MSFTKSPVYSVDALFPFHSFISGGVVFIFAFI